LGFWEVLYINYLEEYLFQRPGLNLLLFCYINHTDYVSSQDGSGYSTNILVCAHNNDRLDYSVPCMIIDNGYTQGCNVKVLCFGTAALTI
jgi:hypothetical protein